MPEIDPDTDEALRRGLAQLRRATELSMGYTPQLVSRAEARAILTHIEAAEVRAEQLAAELRIREESQIPVIPRAAQERLVAAEAERDRLAARAKQLEAALQPLVEQFEADGLYDHSLANVPEDDWQSGPNVTLRMVRAARAAVAGDPEISA